MYVLTKGCELSQNMFLDAPLHVLSMIINFELLNANLYEMNRHSLWDIYAIGKCKM